MPEPVPLRSNFEPGTSRWATRRAQWRALGLTDEDMARPGIVWSRTPDNYENIAQVLAALEVIGPDGSVSLYDATK